MLAHIAFIDASAAAMDESAALINNAGYLILRLVDEWRREGTLSDLNVFAIHSLLCDVESCDPTVAASLKMVWNAVNGKNSDQAEVAIMLAKYGDTLFAKSHYAQAVDVFETGISMLNVKAFQKVTPSFDHFRVESN